MKRVTTLVLAMSLLGGTAVIAAPPDPPGGQPPQCGAQGQPACPPGTTPSETQTTPATGDEQQGPQGRRGKGNKGGEKTDQQGQPTTGPTGQPASGQQTPPSGPPSQTNTPPTTTGPTFGGPNNNNNNTTTENQNRDRDRNNSNNNNNNNDNNRGDGNRGDNNNRGDDNRGDNNRNDNNRYGDRDNNRDWNAGNRRWRTGDRLPDNLRQERFIVRDWRANNLRQPPSGYFWFCQAGRDCFLVDNRTGYIREARWYDDRDNNWRRRYSRVYTYNDDVYYRDCRSRPDPAGILAGGLIGGLLGNRASDGRAGGTFAGIIIGASLGAALTRDMDCDDRSYAYRSYYDALNSGRIGRVYRWDNRRNRHRGEFRVRSYTYDNDGFYCANYTHTVWINGRRRLSNGLACRQPDGSWAFIR